MFLSGSLSQRTSCSACQSSSHEQCHWEQPTKADHHSEESLEHPQRDNQVHQEAGWRLWPWPCIWCQLWVPYHRVSLCNRVPQCSEHPSLVSLFIYWLVSVASSQTRSSMVHQMLLNSVQTWSNRSRQKCLALTWTSTLKRSWPATEKTTTQSLSLLSRSSPSLTSKATKSRSPFSSRMVPSPTKTVSTNTST